MSVEDTIAQLREWADAYYNGEAIVSDETYDSVYDQLRLQAPNHPFFCETGAPIKGNKLQHTYFTGSLSKVKPDTPELKRFLKKAGTCGSDLLVLSEKLDGVSIVFQWMSGNEKSKPSWLAMSRGDGIQGQDVSRNLFQPGFDIPDAEAMEISGFHDQLNGKPLVVRGELIIPRSYQSEKPLRSIVNGVVNTKTPNLELLPEVHFLAYGLPGSGLTPLEQMKQLDKMGFRTPVYVEFKLIKRSIAKQLLKHLLVKWKEESAYDIDGVVMSYNVYEAPSSQSSAKNPELSKAFKMLLDEQTKETYIDSIDWRISGSGFLHPTAILKPPVVIGSATIRRVTCFHAEFVEKNRIGPGAKVLISRSGDVIPKIEKVIQAAATPALPTHLTYKWDETHKNIYLDDDGQHLDEISQAAFLEFSSRLDINGLKKGTITRFCEAGIKTPEILAELSLEDIQHKTGLKKQAATIYHSFHASMKSMSISKFIHARGIMGRGFGKRVVQAFIDEIGYHRFAANDLADSKASASSRDVVGGIQRWSAYLDKYTAASYPVLKSYLEQMIARELATNKPNSDEAKESDSDKDSKTDTKMPLSGKQYLFTGGKDKTLVEQIESLGGTIVSRIPSKDYETITLLTASLDSSSSKMKAAQQKNIPILLTHEFTNQIASL